MKNLILGIFVGLLAGAGVASIVWNSELHVATVHAAILAERADACEAKFSYSTVIVAPAAPAAQAAAAPGVNFYHGIFRLSVNSQALAGANPLAPGASSEPQARYIIPARITPQAVGPANGEVYYWIKGVERTGPYPLEAVRP